MTEETSAIVSCKLSSRRLSGGWDRHRPDAAPSSSATPASTYPTHPEAVASVLTALAVDPDHLDARRTAERHAAETLTPDHVVTPWLPA